MLCEADAVKTDGVAISNLGLDEYFFHSDGGRGSAAIVITKKSKSTTNVQVKRSYRLT
jgi:hypothetical protein